MSSFFVWLSYTPGRVEILWKDYFIETNLLAIVIFFGAAFILFYVFFGIIRKIRELPNLVKNQKTKKYLRLGNNALDNLAVDLVLGDADSIEKNSRKLKKYFGNNIFSTFMFFFSSLIKNDLSEAQRYLVILEKIEKSGYLHARSKALFLIKQGDFEHTKTFLEFCCGKFSKDVWFFEKLASLYVSRGSYDKALENLDRLKVPKSIKIKQLQANLKILSGGNTMEALKISKSSIYVIINSIKYFIDISEYKKAAKIFQQAWKNFYCFEIVETFIDYKRLDPNDALKRYKLISKFLQSTFKLSNESKFSLAYCAFKAEIWGESQKFLDLIPNDQIDERVIELYKELEKKIPKMKTKKFTFKPKSPPHWNCSVCNLASVKWKFICENCQSIDSFIWMSNNKIQSKEKSKLLLGDLFKNPMRHFPKM